MREAERQAVRERERETDRVCERESQRGRERVREGGRERRREIERKGSLWTVRKELFTLAESKEHSKNLVRRLLPLKSNWLLLPSSQMSALQRPKNNLS